MSAPVKRTVLTLVAAMLMAAFSTFFAITVVRLLRQHQSEDDGDSPAASDSAAASDSPAAATAPAARFAAETQPVP